MLFEDLCLQVNEKGMSASLPLVQDSSDRE